MVGIPGKVQGAPGWLDLIFLCTSQGGAVGGRSYQLQGCCPPHLIPRLLISLGKWEWRQPWPGAFPPQRLKEALLCIKSSSRLSSEQGADYPVPTFGGGGEGAGTDPAWLDGDPREGTLSGDPRSPRALPFPQAPGRGGVVAEQGSPLPNHPPSHTPPRECTSTQCHSAWVSC